MYTCGPTVYDRAHIGNLRYFTFCDLFRRYLEYSGLRVRHVLNLTDVDDKTIKKSRDEGRPLKEITQKYADIFFEDCKLLNLEQPTECPRATEYIKEMVALIKKLLNKGYAYKSEDGSIYYDISKFRDYGKLSHTKLRQLEEGASGRIKKDEYAKEDVQDFALWKAWTEGDGEVYWETELGAGRPGWHIECSVMAAKLLGIPFDCHLGGVDLIFPHHENEIAQSEAATGKKFANYWIHIEHLLVDDRKMSKSLGNFYTLKDLLDKGYKPKPIKYLLLSTHYRQKLNFSFEALETATNSLKRLYEFWHEINSITKASAQKKEVDDAIKEVKTNFERAMDNDLQISEALGAIFEFVRKINTIIKGIGKKDADKIKRQILEFNKVLDIFWIEKAPTPKEIAKLVKERETARNQKKWAVADAIRDEIKAKGYEIKDTEKGPQLRKI